MLGATPHEHRPGFAISSAAVGVCVECTREAGAHRGGVLSRGTFLAGAPRATTATYSGTGRAESKTEMHEHGPARRAEVMEQPARLSGVAGVSGSNLPAFKRRSAISSSATGGGE